MAGEDHRVCFWDVADGKLLRSFEAHPGQVSCVLYTRDGKTLVTSGWDEAEREEIVSAVPLDAAIDRLQASAKAALNGIAKEIAAGQEREHR